MVVQWMWKLDGTELVSLGERLELSRIYAERGAAWE